MAEFTIGFGNISEKMEFARIVRQGFESAVAKYDDIALMVRDNDLDNQKASANIEAFVEANVDLIVMFHGDVRYNRELGLRKLGHNIPTVAIDIPMPLATFFGANNAEAGRLAGNALCDWSQANWNGNLDKVLVVADSRLVGDVSLRLTEALNVLFMSGLVRQADVLHIDGGNVRAEARQTATLALAQWKAYDHIAVIGLNDDALIAVLDAAAENDMTEQIVGVSHGASNLEEARSDEKYRGFLGSVAYFPERYGDYLLELALMVKNGERLPEKRFVDHEIVLRDALKNP